MLTFPCFGSISVLHFQNSIDITREKRRRLNLFNFLNLIPQNHTTHHFYGYHNVFKLVWCGLSAERLNAATGNMDTHRHSASQIMHEYPLHICEP